MLSRLKISNIALIDELEIEFGPRLNLLTGETGSGKSIIVDSLGALTGERVSSDIIKEGQDAARIEGLFELDDISELREILDESGIELDAGGIQLIIRRDISLAGRNRIFLNDQLITAALLKRISPFLADIHGQGEQATLFDTASHREMLDEFASVGPHLEKTAAAFAEWNAVRAELEALKADEAGKLQLVDILRFQTDEIRRADLKPDEEASLEEEKRRLANVEKLSQLSTEAFAMLYEMDDSAVSQLGQAARRIEELAEYDAVFREQLDGLRTAQAVLEDLAITVRDFRGGLEFSPERLEEIENRLAEISRVARKYGGTVETAIEHLNESERRLENIDTAELREKELTRELAEKRAAYIDAASKLSEKRRAAATRFSAAVVTGLKTVALEKARFEVNITSPLVDELSNDTADRAFTSHGFDTVEFLFSANPGESPKPIAKVASGGEASRLMLILKTAGRPLQTGKTAVFDEIDAGIGGRVAESVGLKLKQLAAAQQVLCVTHQAQVASKADRHLVVEKRLGRKTTEISVRELGDQERVEEIARMLAGETVTDAARENAREMIAAA